MKNYLLILFTLFLFTACSESKKPLPDLDPGFEKVLEAHGDWEKFYQGKAFSYQMIHETNLTKETHFINLETRETRIDADNFQIGFDGEQAWISPNRESFGGNSVRFYHNLYFYFFAIPYVFTDPGVTVTKVENKTVNGTSYETFAASFEADKGDSPNDQYYMLINPESNRIEYLLYTVTYYGNPDPAFSALKYDDYRDAGGLSFPRLLTGYTYQDDSTKRVRYQVSFSDALILDEAFDKSLFEKPETGVFAD
ncbi:DUF6503 family protein [Algoriphagus sediminis]|uniref:Lipoprotein n=1 Tax=Algoriphagus sediminis TaxID=3057113 RepID=A0ABT7Y8C8_9BACT|nr:DUF6503 family protein [Algoriphagus sediminis]MDN3202778.1 hypothetical protein [Algoriphagus sediminis]